MSTPFVFICDKGMSSIEIVSGLYFSCLYCFYVLSFYIDLVSETANLSAVSSYF